MENQQTAIILLQICIGAIVSLIPSTIIGYWGYKNQSRMTRINENKAPAETDATKGDAVSKFATGYEKLCQDLQDQINVLTARQDRSDEIIASQGKRITYLENGIRKLVAQVKSLGADPVFDINGEK